MFQAKWRLLTSSTADWHYQVLSSIHGLPQSENSITFTIKSCSCASAFHRPSFSPWRLMTEVMLVTQCTTPICVSSAVTRSDDSIVMFAMLVLSVSGVNVCIIVSVCFSMCAFFFFLTAAASVFFPPSVKGLENRYKIEAENTLGWEGLGWVQRSNTFLSLFLCPNLTSTSTHTQTGKPTARIECPSKAFVYWYLSGAWQLVSPHSLSADSCSWTVM